MLDTHFDRVQSSELVANLFIECESSKGDYHGLCKCVMVFGRFVIADNVQPDCIVEEYISSDTDGSGQVFVDVLDIWYDGELEFLTSLNL